MNIERGSSAYLDKGVVIDDIDKSDEKVTILGININKGVAKNIKEYLESEQRLLLLDQIARLNGNKKLEERIAGSLFEDIAYRWLSDQIKNNEVLLSPREVFKLWSVLYSDRKIEEKTGIRGVSVPDGLIVKEGEKYIFITTVVEYKNLPRESNSEIDDRIREQSSHYRQDVFAIELKREGIAKKMGGVLNELRPELPKKPLIVVTRGGLKLLHVIPQNSSIYIPASMVKRIPITCTDLYRLKNSLMKEAAVKEVRN